MHSCYYRGRVGHCRYEPVKHAFRYGLFMAYLDLNELPQLFARGLLSQRKRSSAASFLRTDHWGDPGLPLDECVRQLVDESTGSRPAGPIRLLTQLRSWGHYFSPLNLFYCFDELGERIVAVVAEVTNTPWGERHTYVLWQGNAVEGGGSLRFRHPKSFHVSPFMEMDAEYVWSLTSPGQQLRVELGAERQGKRLFDASMDLRSAPLSRDGGLWLRLRYPCATIAILAAIYYEALRLWLKKVPVYAHP